MWIVCTIALGPNNELILVLGGVMLFFCLWLLLFVSRLQRINYRLTLWPQTTHSCRPIHSRASVCRCSRTHTRTHTHTSSPINTYINMRVCVWLCDYPLQLFSFGSAVRCVPTSWHRGVNSGPRTRTDTPTRQRAATRSHLGSCPMCVPAHANTHTRANEHSHKFKCVYTTTERRIMLASAHKSGALVQAGA